MPDAAASQPPPTWANASAPRNPMEAHVKAIAVLDIVFGCLAAVVALIFLALFGIGTAATGASGAPRWLPGFLAGLGVVFAVFVGLFAALFLVAGFQLLHRRRSGKVMGIVAACFQLISFPLGTALGIYALVILTRPETEHLLVN
ncbi:MAG TPA: hypothetical protein VM241_05700 [Candidatus Thermoplasmatota archaeon]|nr:hypothetical protein [Candidatus Thermoplasmatota archaeon]